MNEKRMWGPFWAGFVVVGVAALLFYRWWQEEQVTTQRPLSLRGYQPPAMTPTTAGVRIDVGSKDDLTAVKGIGATYARRLDEAGIYRYEDLARLTPEALRTMIGLRGRDGLPESWITQAQALAVSQGR